ncbi:MAG: hypothetical protein P8Z37_00750 [Acidobacteriota bacterium]
MITKRTKFAFLLLLAGLIFSVMPATSNAQGGPDQDPLLTVKISDIDKLLNDIEGIATQIPGANVKQQFDQIRMMLQGTDWIDTGRCITIGVVMGNAQPSGIALIPFLTPNETFQNMYGASAGTDYYVLPVPPGQNLVVSPALEQMLNESSKIPVSGSIVLEASAGKILTMMEPAMAAVLAQIENSQPADAPPNPLSTEDMNTIFQEMFAIMKQAEIIRFGLDFSDDAVSILADIDAQPGTELAEALVDVGGNPRLMNYPFDMPLQYHMRAYNMYGAQKLMKSYIGNIYGMLGVDIDIENVMQMSKNFTGEAAGGINITPEGLTIRTATVLQPGVDGEAFLRDSYLPMLESYSTKISELSAEQDDSPETVIIQRTADSSIGGINTMGIKMHLQSPDASNGSGLDNMEIEMRFAAVDDLVFITSSDAEIKDLIDGTSNLTPVPASGPTGSMALDIAALLNTVKSMMPPGQPVPEFPEDLGPITTTFDMKDGRLATRTRIGMDMINKLVSYIAAEASKAKPESTQSPGAI